MAYLDFKVTQWRRIYVPNNMVGVVQNKLNSGDLSAPYDLLNEPDKYYEMDMGVDEICEDIMSVDENGGCPTQEIFTDEGDSVWMNTDPVTIGYNQLLDIMSLGMIVRENQLHGEEGRSVEDILKAFLRDGNYDIKY